MQRFGLVTQRRAKKRPDDPGLLVESRQSLPQLIRRQPLRRIRQLLNRVHAVILGGHGKTVCSASAGFNAENSGPGYSSPRRVC